MTWLQKLFGADAPNAPRKQHYREGETVQCEKCRKSVTVKFHQPGKAAFATKDTLRTVALKCQDCGFVVCASCAMPPGGGGAVCPSCKTSGGPYFFTR